jgi:hypothetical protein
MISRYSQLLNLSNLQLVGIGISILLMLAILWRQRSLRRQIDYLTWELRYSLHSKRAKVRSKAVRPQAAEVDEQPATIMYRGRPFPPKRESVD